MSDATRDDDMPSVDEILAAAIACGRTYEAAAALANLSKRSVIRRVEDEGFRARVREMQRQMVDQALGVFAAGMTAAAEKIRSMFGCTSLTPSVQLQAAKSFIELHFRTREQVEIVAQINEMKDRLAQAEDRAAEDRAGSPRHAAPNY